jgi:hypothetical protein
LTDVACGILDNPGDMLKQAQERPGLGGKYGEMAQHARLMNKKVLNLYVFFLLEMFK